MLCLNVGNVAKLVVGGSEFQTLTTLSAKNWLRTPLILCNLKSLCACPLVPLVGRNSKKSEKFMSTRPKTVLLQNNKFK